MPLRKPAIAVQVLIEYASVSHAPRDTGSLNSEDLSVERRPW